MITVALIRRKRTGSEHLRRLIMFMLRLRKNIDADDHDRVGHDNGEEMRECCNNDYDDGKDKDYDNEKEFGRKKLVF